MRNVILDSVGNNAAAAAGGIEMVRIRKSEDRGGADHGWLDTRHTFSFAGYHDPDHMGFRSLRVINDDRVAPAAGFPEHPHRDMEIVTYVVEGALEHRDSMGNGSVMRAGEVQRMSAGTGVTHSEFNPSETEEGRFLQIWILPREHGTLPGYEQRGFEDGELRDQLRLVASPDGREGSLTVNQDVDLYAARLGEGRSLRHDLAQGRYAWVQMVRGRARLGGEELLEGDGAAVSGETVLDIHGEDDSEILVFDLA
jgi:redox-sensitive bicupin YhaK (pirin superfamily)